MENSDKKRILEMIKEGKISVDEGVELLNAINEPRVADEDVPVTVVRAPSNKRRKLRIEVVAQDGNNDHANVSVAIPLNIVKAMLPVLNSGIIPETARSEMSGKGIDMDAVMAAIESVMNNLDELDEDIVSVDAGEGDEGAKVKIYVD